MDTGCICPAEPTEPGKIEGIEVNMSVCIDIHTKLTQERLRELTIYNSETGVFTWAVSRRRCTLGGVAGCIRGDGSWGIRIDGHLYRAHRLAWLYMTGEWPPEEIDHKNRIKSDNSWSNLRLATRLQNQINVVLYNSTGFSNVDKIGKRFRARAKINGVHKHLGMADTAEEAHAISVRERRKIHGEFVISQVGVV